MSDSFEIRSASQSYGITIARGGAGAFLAERPGATILCDAIFADRFDRRDVIGIEAVEPRKTLDEAGRIIAALRERGVSRGDRLLVVGGGVVQDLACFVASTYMRGVAWDYCPTTLLGMADSCIGGKSSLNVGAFKNIAGTYHPPDHILIDVDYAATLADAQFAGGLCEAAKICFAHGVESFAEYLSADAGRGMEPDDLARVVGLSLRAKTWFIETDEFDRKERLTLNFGHTFGHALEAATDFALNHGLAVGIGVMGAITFAARETGTDGAATRALYLHMRDLVRPALAPAAVAGLDPDRFVRAFLSDKKHGRDGLSLILPVRDGALPLGRVSLPRSDDTILAVMRSLSDVLREFLPVARGREDVRVAALG